jgi:hypothetical protein
MPERLNAQSLKGFITALAALRHPNDGRSKPKFLTGNVFQETFLGVLAHR